MNNYVLRNKKLWATVTLFVLIITSVFSVGQPASANTSQVVLTKSGGWLESAHAEWSKVTGAEGYHVYYKKSNQSDSQYVKIHDILTREYANHYRADAVGLAAGTYNLKVVPVINGAENNAKAAVTGNLTVNAYTREGFAFSSNSAHGTGSGAYNDDGTLKSGAQVIYITPETASTVQLDVITSTSGATTTCTGIGDILTARQKGIDTTPLAIRLIGNVKASQMTGINSSGYLQLKGKAAYTEMNITIEGIGEDATINGWGILIRNSANVEIRNLAVMLFPDDGISLDTTNENIWVHNNDIFYGTAGGDSDQAKGDGSIDLKGNSRYVTISYNHFWDSGKSSLCGMKSETGPNYITYHHNWFDHSDSRHPRIRTMTVHIYNNYFDGNAKYGVGVTMGASAFVESNYFRNCKYPMLISLQGTDIINGVANGTFSGENGGMIKAYGNHIEGATRFVDQNSESTHFDAITVTNKNDTVSSSYKAAVGGTTYNNFDTNSSIMYSYNPDDAQTAKVNTMTYAGRVNGGDLKWTFDNAVDDTDYSVNEGLMAAIRAYTGSVVSIGGSTIDDTNPTDPVEPTDPVDPVDPVEPTEPEVVEGGYQYIADTTNALNTSNYYTVAGSLTTNGKTQTYDGKSLEKALKMDSSGSITFTTTTDNAVLTIGVNANKASSALKVGTTTISDINTGTLQQKQITLGAAGSYTIKKGANECYVYYVVVNEN